MNLHEFQAKALLAEYGVAVPAHCVVANADEAGAALDALGGSDWVVKAQVHAGGRGKAGGVRRVRSREEAITAIRALLGTRLVIYQTGVDGQPVSEILIEKLSNIVRELYLGMVVDRAQRKAVLMASTEGGVDIETVAVERLLDDASGEPLVLMIKASGLKETDGRIVLLLANPALSQSVDDESWGLDNVHVLRQRVTVPAPATAVMMSPLALLAARRRR